LIELPEAPALEWSGWKRLRIAGFVAIGLQFVALALLAAFLYHRMALEEDYGVYNQAWTLIAHGHLNPFNSIYGRSFLKSQFELIMWPLALLYFIYPHGIVLLWVQALATAGCGLVVYLWTVEFLQSRKVSKLPTIIICSCVLVSLAVNPIIYQTITFDFHFEPIATLFALLAARELWRGRYKRAWLWVGFMLLCGNLPGLYVVGLGLSAFLAGRALWRMGVLLVIAGIAWLGFISAIGANQGSDLVGYAYLAGRTTLPSGALVIIVAGMVAHPNRPFHEITSRLSDIYTFLKPVGVVGLVSAWGFGIPILVLLSSALNGNPIFIIVAFQNFPVAAFVLIGTVMSLVWLGQRFRWGWIATGVIGLAVVVQLLVFGLSNTPSLLQNPSSVAAGPAAVLRSVLTETPTSAEVIGTLGIVGRFSSRPYVYLYYYFAHPHGELLPVQSRTVVVVIVPANEVGFVTPEQSDAAIAYFGHTLRAHVLARKDGVYAFEWHPRKGTKNVTIPVALR